VTIIAPRSLIIIPDTLLSAPSYGIIAFCCLADATSRMSLSAATPSPFPFPLSFFLALCPTLCPSRFFSSALGLLFASRAVSVPDPRKLSHKPLREAQSRFGKEGGGTTFERLWCVFFHANARFRLLTITFVAPRTQECNRTAAIGWKYETLRLLTESPQSGRPAPSENAATGTPMGGAPFRGFA